MVYSDPYIHLSVADSHINYDLPRMRGNETRDWNRFPLLESILKSINRD